MDSISNLSLADRIGVLEAEIAPLEKQLKALKDEIKAQGAGRYEGVFYDATVSVSERDTLDMKAVREKLSPQFIAAHTKTSQVVALRVTAKLNAK